MNKAPFTREYLLNFFQYDRDQGILIWKDHWCRSKKNFIGKVAGCVKTYPHGAKYKVVLFEAKQFNQHRLIYFIETNVWPKVIDHIDGNGLNNIFTNLRNVTTRKNGQNHKRHRKGRLVGASFNKTLQAWTSQLTMNGKVLKLGVFNTETQAHQRYMSELKIRGLL